MERSMLVTVMPPCLAAWLGLSRGPPGGAEPRGSCLADLPSGLEHCSPRWCAPLSRKETIKRTPCIPTSIALPVLVSVVLLLASGGALVRSSVTQAAGGRALSAARALVEMAAAQGITFYAFGLDKLHMSACTGTCATF
jgi:hypothetical protein